MELKGEGRMIAVLANTRSGKKNGLQTGTWVLGQLKKQQINCSLFLDDWPLDLSTFSDAWIIGGDGTVNYFLNRYPNSDLPIAIFKGGTGNDLSWKLNGEISPDQELHIALHARPRPVDYAKCNELFYINSSGIGFDGEVLRSMSAIRSLGGHLGYLMVVVKKIFSFKEFNFQILADGAELTGQYLLVIVNNSSRTGGGFMVTPNASVTDGKIDLMLCKKLSVLKRLRYLPVIEKGKHLSLPFIKYAQVNKVIIRCAHKVYAQLDGELISGNEFVFQVCSAKLLVRYHNASS